MAASPSTLEYSVFSKHVKRFVVVMASWAAFFSPLASQIYLPALNTLASDLHVSIGLINLTLTSYMVRKSHYMDSQIAGNTKSTPIPIDIPGHCASLRGRFR